MSALVDSSSPVRFSGTPANSVALASASFTAPADAFLVCCVESDSQAAGTLCVYSVTDSGTLTWTQRVERASNEATDGGESSIWTARTTSAVSRTVSVTRTGGLGGTNRVSAKLYVVTGADVNGTPADTVGASNEGGSATNNLTTTPITAGANGLLFCSDTDWNQLGVFTSSDLTVDTADYAGAISVCSGYKAVTSGASVGGDLDAAGTAAAQHKWCQIVVREAAGAATKAPPPYQSRWRRNVKRRAS